LFPSLGEDGKPIFQKDVVIDTIFDEKLGRLKEIKKEIFQDYKPGRRISLPADEATFVLRGGIAKATENTLG
jgi:hypothetical protein